MFLDSLNTFCYGQSLVQATGSYDSTNTIDIGSAGLPGSANGGGARDLGVGDDPALKIYVSIAQPVVGAGASLQVLLQGAPDNGAGAPGTFYPLANGIVFAAPLPTGARLLRIDMPRVPHGQPLPRFLKLTFVISGAAITAGTITGAIVLDEGDRPLGPQGAQSGYPEAITVPN